MKKIIRRLNDYSQKSRKYFYEAEEEIAKGNLKILLRHSAVTSVLFITFTALAFIIKNNCRPFAEHIFFLPAFILLCCLAFVYLKKGGCNKIIVNALCIGYEVILFIFIILIDTVFKKTEPSCFMPMICIILSASFIYPLVFTNILISFFDFAYILMVFLVKSPYIREYDVLSGLVALGLSYVISYLIMTLHMYNYNMRKKYKQFCTKDTLIPGIYNKNGCQEAIEEYIIDHNYIVRCSFFFLDLDDFKMINDTYGHFTGDAVLISVSRVLKTVFKSNDIIARWGGDEFVILAENICDETTAEVKCRNIFRMLSCLSAEKQRIEIKCSIGVLVVNDSKVDFNLMLREADMAMYAAKKTGKGKYTIRRYENAA